MKINLNLNEKDVKSVRIPTVCPICCRENSVYLTLKQAANYKRFLRGEGQLQELLPTLDPAEREMLYTGTCDECWQTFADPDDDEVSGEWVVE